MKVTRKSVFETNSSSAHTLCLTTDCRSKLDLNIKDGVLTVELGEYGPQERRLTTPQEKLNYIFTLAFNWYSDKYVVEQDELDDVLKKLHENTDYELFVFWLSDTLNIKTVEYEMPNSCAYVDNQSCYEEVVKYYMTNWLNIISNPNVIIVIRSDCYELDNDLVRIYGA